MDPDLHKKLAEQSYVIGNNWQAWIWNATILRKAATLLEVYSSAGSNRFVDLVFKEPAPPPGETQTRNLTPDEVAALEDKEIWSVSMFLLALAVECLVKATLAKRDVKLVDANGALLKKFQIHDLDRLAKYADLRISESDFRILAWLTQFSLWRGRYPIPKESERLRQLATMELGNWGEVTKRAFALYDRIAGLLSPGPVQEA